MRSNAKRWPVQTAGQLANGGAIFALSLTAKLLGPHPGGVRLRPGARIGMAILALLVPLVLSACSSFTPGAAPAPGKLRPLDLVNDDLAGLIIVFDVPVALSAIPTEARFTLNYVSPTGERQVASILDRGDAGSVMSVLPAPTDGRTYFIFAFSAADRSRLEAAQAFARTAASIAPSLRLSPEFCSNDPVDAAKTTVTVLVVAPGQVGIDPGYGRETLAGLLARTGATLPECADL